MIQINSRVRSTNPDGSIQCVGTVLALFQPEYFLTCTQVDPDHMWKDRFPDWKSKAVVFVGFDEPQRNATLAEWLESANRKGLDPEEAAQTYELECPTIHQTAFPIDDLEESKT